MMTHGSDQARDGFALPATLLAMIVIGAIVTGGFFLASQEHNISVSTDQGARALHVAQYGLEEALGTWTGADLARGPVAGSVYNGSRELGTYTLTPVRLGDPATGSRLHAIISEAETGRHQYRGARRVGTFVRTSAASLPYKSALSLIGQLDRQGGAVISGEDQCGAESAATGVMAIEEGMVTGFYRGQEQMIFGDPPADYDDEMTPETLSDFGEVTLADLMAMATRYYQGNPANPQHMAPETTTTDAGTVCDRSVDLNWGDPDEFPGPCGDFYPLIHIDSDALLDVGRGQGILVVDGNLTVLGNFEFSGIVIVTGSFVMEGTGSKINGSVIVHGQGEIDTENDQSGNARIQYDSCKVAEALANNLRVRPLASRAWFTDMPPLQAGI